jgi:hypothetical protein
MLNPNWGCSAISLHDTCNFPFATLIQQSAEGQRMDPKKPRNVGSRLLSRQDHRQSPWCCWGELVTAATDPGRIEACTGALRSISRSNSAKARSLQGLALGFEILILGGDAGIAKFHCSSLLPEGSILQYVRSSCGTCILGRGRRYCTDERLGSSK